MENPRGSDLRRSLSTGRSALLPVGVFSMVFNVLALAIPLYMIQVYDRVLVSGSRETLFFLTVIIIGVVLVIALLDTVRSEIAVRVSGWLEDQLAPKAFARAIEAALQQSAYTTEALRDLSTVRCFIGNAFLFILFDAVWAPIYLAVIFLLHPWLGVVALLGVLLLTALAALNERITRVPLQAANHLWIRSLHKAEMVVRNAEAVIGMGMTGALTARWMAGNGRALDLRLLANRRSTLMLATTKGMRLLIQVAILAIGAVLMLDQRISPGSMFAALIILARALAPLEQAIGTWKQIVDYREARDRLIGFFDAPPLPQRGMTLPVPQGRLTVEGVTFAPPSAEEAVLKNVSFVAEPGEVIAIVGPSAAGKSTLARLIVAAWQPRSGTIRLDGAEVYDWPREEFGLHVGYLPQDVELFAGTVRDNIARMREAADADVVAAAQMAGVHETILRLPNGYRTDIGEGGVRLSAGQRQRVALARAVFGGPRLIVLDEPNANLDANGELALAQAVIALKQIGATTLVISHRQSILMQTDKILVLSNGRVEQFGPRNDVLRRLVPPHRRQATSPQPVPTIAAETAEASTVS